MTRHLKNSEAVNGIELLLDVINALCPNLSASIALDIQPITKDVLPAMPPCRPISDPVPSAFHPTSDGAVGDLVKRHPLAWLVTADFAAHLMPVTPRFDPEGKLIGFGGHIPLRTAARIEQCNQLLILVSGPNAYISPSWFENRRQAPTWSSQSAAFLCIARTGRDEGKIRQALNELVQAMEVDRVNPWALEELKDRYDQLANAIAWFEADITEHRASFRLCQDDDLETFALTLSGLSKEGHEELVNAMIHARTHVT